MVIVMMVFTGDALSADDHSGTADDHSHHADSAANIGDDAVYSFLAT
jgi:hypothetical protein